MTDIAESYLRLANIPNVGPSTVRKLIARFGSPIDALKATRSDLMSLERVGAKIADAFVSGVDKVDIDAIKRKIAAYDADFICIDDDAYPARLRLIYDAPIGLYVAGKANLNADSIAIVGCRNCSVYGRLAAKKFANNLGLMGFEIVSGLARGIDTAAHFGALEVNAKTVAVLGCGLDIVYPPENVDLFKSIKNEGAIISEYPIGTRADKQTFPMRNRIIAGMSLGTLLVESDLKGGGMITARLACDYGRDVFAVPGRIDQSTSAGCHSLIREGATLATCAEEIADALGYGVQKVLNMEGIRQDCENSKNSENAQSKRSTQTAANLSESDSKILEALAKGDALAADEIAEITSLEISQILASAMMLELKKLIVKRTDGRWEKRF